ncbi:hypothetical protein [Brevifollis gellanilyticus]|nr:hypothetical protein [Brevifollis gellanilyticus]
MPHVIQLLLPLCAFDQKPLPQDLHAKVKAELMQKFGGLTTYSRPPIHGQEPPMVGKVQEDRVAYEVVAWEFDEVWWSGYRHALERRFDRRDVVVRARTMQWR